MQVTFSALLKGAKVLKSAGTVSDKFNSLALIYCFAPPDEHSYRIYHLFIECIPEAIVALAAIPIVYWLLYRRSLAVMIGESYRAEANGEEAVRSFSKQGGFMEVIQEEIKKASTEELDNESVNRQGSIGEANGQKHILIVVDLQAR